MIEAMQQGAKGRIWAVAAAVLGALALGACAKREAAASPPAWRSRAW